MFRPPFLARVAAGAAVYVLEETRRLPSTAAKLPLTAVSQLLQTGMHVQQFVTSLAIKGDSVFDRIVNRPEERPEWATFEEDDDDPPVREPGAAAHGRSSGFDRFESDPVEVELALQETLAGLRAIQNNGSAVPAAHIFDAEATFDIGASDDPGDDVVVGAAAVDGPESAASADPEPVAEPEPAAGPVLPEVGARYDYPNMTLAQLRGRLRTLTVADLVTLLDYEQRTLDRAAFVTMLTNRIATVRAQ
ncbi:lipid droplet-associated protein [Nocardia sp. NBC_01329]|uniref:lipid droplet-associated protein n=1 Tax=Nocardia sp. NBC_01329 TaxID=2903594 RepID=UPI002E141D91|nr:lipid droplet-associated protein [Nocardia sp. NBC_01329]